MVISDYDELTEFNTSLNKTAAIVESKESKPKIRKSITLNTSIISSPTKLYSPERTTTTTTKRKSILKSSEPQEPEMEQEPDQEFSPPEDFLATTEFYKSLQDFANEEHLAPNCGEASFSLRDIDEDDELYLIDIPKHLNPHELVGVTLDTDRSKKKLKISNEKFTWVPDEDHEDFTCVMATGKEKNPFRAVNVKATGKIVLRKHKSSGKLEDSDEEGSKRVRFPEHLRVRNPHLLGKFKRVKKVKVKKEKRDSD